jgi:glutaminyl-peptide cyclotransferase
LDVDRFNIRLKVNLFPQQCFTTDNTHVHLRLRYLADQWANTYIPPHTKRRLRLSATEISTIDHLILLDLLGTPNPSIRSYFPDTGWLFDAMISVENRLALSGAFGSAAQEGDFRSFFVPRKGNERNLMFIEDDHIPFMKQGVSVLHIIANPFPHVWHTLRVSIIYKVYVSKAE